MINVQLPSAISTDYGSGTTSQAAGGSTSPAPSAGNAPQGLSLPGANVSAQPKQPTEAELQRAVASLQQKAQKVAPSLQFSIDRDTSRIVIKVTDSATQEVIRQFPPEEVLRMDKELDRLQGLLLNKQA